MALQNEPFKMALHTYIHTEDLRPPADSGGWLVGKRDGVVGVGVAAVLSTIYLYTEGGKERQQLLVFLTRHGSIILIQTT